MCRDACSRAPGSLRRGAMGRSRALATIFEWRLWRFRPRSGAPRPYADRASIGVAAGVGERLACDPDHFDAHPPERFRGHALAQLETAMRIPQQARLAHGVPSPGAGSRGCCCTARQRTIDGRAETPQPKPARAHR